MQKLQCDICGGQIEMEAGGQRGVCQNCGMAYSLNRMREMFAGLKVSVTGSQEDVNQWKKLVNTYLQAHDYEAAEKTVKKILEASPEDAFANEIYIKLQDWKFLTIKNGCIVGYSGKSWKIVIPEGVKKIEKSAFEGCDFLISVELPDGVEEIGAYAFKGCSSMKTIAIPNSVNTIEDGAFEGCRSLKSFGLPGKISKLGKGVFVGCEKLKTIKLADGLFEMPISSFLGY